MHLDFSNKLAKIRKQCIGCLVGGGVGDALGYPVEFLSYDKILSKYGHNGITEYDLTKSEKALISDDTQMTYFTGLAMENILYAHDLKYIHHQIVDDVYKQYLIWVKGQLEGYDINSKLPKALFEHRAPGTTCVSSLLGKKKGTMSQRINNSKGAGGLMRVAPIALISDKDKDIVELMLLGADVAAITHSHELGFITASMLVDLIRRIVNGDNVEQAVLGSLYSISKLFSQSNYLPQLSQIIINAMHLAKRNLEDEEAINCIGQGWVAEEALAIAIFCSIKHQDNFENAIISAVNHSGDSDTTGAITGNIMGALLGIDAIPSKFQNNLELEKELENMGVTLFAIGRAELLTLNRMLNE